MASALLESRNESYWGERKVYTRKTPNSNPNPRIHAVHNPSPSSSFVHEIPLQVHALKPEDLHAGGSAAAISEEDSSMSRRPAGAGWNWVSYKISGYSRSELLELKRRLVLELEQVRCVTSRIDSLSRSVGNGGDFQPRDLGLGLDPKKVKKPPAAGSESGKLTAGMMKKCSQILSKLMKQKGAAWFNSPVDVVGMGLHDYHQIIKNPMDLGTVKKKLNKGVYRSPPEFAAEIKLTFDNALLYNPPGHDVYRLAGQLLKTFEGLYYPAYEKYEKQLSALSRQEERDRAMEDSWSQVPEAAARRAETFAPVLAPAPPPDPAPIPDLAPAPMAAPPAYGQLQQLNIGRGKQPPKPKAKDANKRSMTPEEKEKLGFRLQNLPPEKMEQVLHIVRRRNADPTRHGDEIELDLEVLDNETLWELDRFLGNCKKMMSKIRRQEALADTTPPRMSTDGGDKSPVEGETPETLAAKKSKKGGEACDEDVDIGDEMPSAHYPSVEIEKQMANASSSSASSSDSSSASDSDSGSPSDTDTDEDDGKAPGN